MNFENLKEGWVSFTRVYCKEGYIDRWVGDQANDPNNHSKHNMNLNSTMSFYRLNDEKWISAYDLKVKGMFISDVVEYSKLFTAEEIWNTFIKK